MNSWHHAKSCARKWGGDPNDYIDVHEFIDSSKKIIGDVRHRAIYHHTEGVWLCQQIFGRTITVSRGTHLGSIEIPTRLIAERHILEDLGWLPSPAGYLKDTPVATWMSGKRRDEVDLAKLLLKQSSFYDPHYEEKQQ